MKRQPSREFMNMLGYEAILVIIQKSMLLYKGPDKDKIILNHKWVSLPDKDVFNFSKRNELQMTKG